MKHLTILKYRFSNAKKPSINTFKTGAEAEKWLKNLIETTNNKLDYHSFEKEII